MDATEKLTQDTVKRLKYQGRTWTGKGDKIQHERHLVWDSETPELGVRVHPSGLKTFVLRYTVKGRRRLMKLGRFPGMPVAVARQRLKDELKAVYGGGDPVEDRRHEHVDTVAKAWEHFEATAMKGMAESTCYNLERTYEKHLKKLARRRLDAVTPHEIERLYADLAEQSVYAANDAIGLLRRLYKAARIADPTVGLKLKGERKRTRALDAAELKALAEALEAEEDLDAADYVRLLMVTGARPGEWRKAAWAWVNFKTGTLRIPSDEAKIRPDEEADERELPPAALEILKRIRERQSPKSGWIFPQAGGEAPRHRNWMAKPWARIAEQAGLEGATLYTLRHTFGTWSVAGGLSLPATAALMGHRDKTTTLRYAHALRGAKKEAAARVAGALEAAMQGEKAEIVRHPRSAG